MKHSQIHIYKRYESLLSSEKVSDLLIVSFQQTGWTNPDKIPDCLPAMSSIMMKPVDHINVVLASIGMFRYTVLEKSKKRYTPTLTPTGVLGQPHFWCYSDCLQAVIFYFSIRVIRTKFNLPRYSKKLLF